MYAIIRPLEDGDFVAVHSRVRQNPDDRGAALVHIFRFDGDRIAELWSKGVVFEHYDMPGMTRDGDVYVSGDLKVAWFNDPDGNILNVAGR